MPKIKVKNPVVELDGDEMTRIIWSFIKNKLILPYLDIELKYYDLGIESRDADRRPDHRRRGQRHQAIRRRRQMRRDHPRRGRMTEFNLKRMYRSPNGTLRNIIGGTIFREPIICKNVPRLVPDWTQPIVIGRHAYGDQYAASDFVVEGAGELTMVFKPAGGGEPIDPARCSTSRAPASPWACTTSTIRSRASPNPASTLP